MATDSSYGEDNRDMSTEASDGPDRSFVYRLCHTLALPIAILILAILYVENTWGAIEPNHLLYPYFVIGLLIMSLIIAVTGDIRELVDEYRGVEDTNSFDNTIRDAISENKVGLVVMLIITGYVILIDIIGFLVASLVGFFAVAKVLGNNSNFRIIIWMLVIVGSIYILFVPVLGVRAPTGIFGI